MRKRLFSEVSRAIRIAGIVLNAILVIAYPIAVFYALTRFSGRTVSIAILALLVPGLAWRFRAADRATFWSIVRLPIAILLLLIAGIITGDPRFVLALPVLINTVLLIEFGASLRSGSVPMIERFARITDADMSEPKIAHCRGWTIAWCAFFCANGAIAGALALAAPLWWWTVYTGAIAYALMGIMFAVERVQRRLRFGV